MKTFNLPETFHFFKNFLVEFGEMSCVIHRLPSDRIRRRSGIHMGNQNSLTKVWLHVLSGTTLSMTTGTNFVVK